MTSPRIAGGLRIGVDTGGTFTDLVLTGPGIAPRIAKVRSTPEDPGRALLEGLEALGVPGAKGATVIHGTTVALNALLTGRVGKAALVTNRGFRDLIEIDRQARPDLYALEPQRPLPLVPRNLRFEVAERAWPADVTDEALGTRGPLVVVEALTDEEIERVCRTVLASGATSVAVCLLHSYAHPEPERRLAARLRDAGLYATASSELVAEYREAERFSTAVANAALTPVVADYLGRLGEALPEARLEILQSSGGGLDAARAAIEPVRVLLSGPAGGVIGAAAAARAAGLGAIATLDMGGTSTDVAFHQEGEGLGSLGEDVRVAGHSIAVPTLDMHTIGCGGGSIARVDEGSVLRVGPESAGADPGPVAFGGGGTQPTVTDAYIVLGRVPLTPHPGGFLGGELRLDRDAALRAYEMLARELGEGVTAIQAAQAVLASVRASMRRALGVMTMQRGRDPRTTPLVAFGGGGGLAAFDLASALGMPLALVPPMPGVLSAYGMTTARRTADRSRTVLRRLGDTNFEAREALLDELRKDATETLLAGGAGAGDAALEAEARLSLRYRGQSYELSLKNEPELEAAFHAAHEARFGWQLEGHGIELVHARARVSVVAPEEDSVSADPGFADESEALVGEQLAWFDGPDPVMTPIHDRRFLRPGAEIFGPAIIDEYSGTTVVPPGARARLSGDVAGGALLLEAVEPSR
ncbi:Acetophenone carboxylase gamma subunit [Planctomycetes bacterium Poly30]|uniref:Acetophenone carboxylase gamma subunit n=1 Tax=Saltatorellus ferox TaxID=2528018 RepID=A0A518ENM1_9BACT|nr:Acetophenone carboxylase gamma subunit [Planctomycetes bacterium Poly30]